MTREECDQRYYLKHRQTIITKALEWAADNPERAKENKYSWLDTHRDEVNKRRRVITAAKRRKAGVPARNFSSKRRRKRMKSDALV